MSKYDSVLAEAADQIVLSGFAEDVFGDAQESAFNALVVVSGEILDNIGVDPDLVSRYDNEYDHGTKYDVWISEDDQGFVTLEYHDPAGQGSTADEFEMAQRVYWYKLGNDSFSDGLDF